MTRLRSDNQFGDLDGALASSTTTLSSPEFAFLPEVTAPDILVLVLDPRATTGLPEIVHVTSHASSATTLTVTRAAETGPRLSAPRAHLSNTLWEHNPTVQDFTPPLLRLTRPAAIPLSGHRAVTVDPSGDLIYADSTIPSHVTLPVFLTTHATLATEPADVVVAGEVIESTWGFTVGDILYLGTNGVLVTSPPVTGFIRELARVVSPTGIVFEPESPIRLTV